MTPPFNTEYPSPISAILALRAGSDSSVVKDAMDEIQRRSYIVTALEERLASELEANPPDLLVISGSAGGGKSALIDYLLSVHAEKFGDVVRDATHADSPSATQAQQLSSFLAPFQRGALPPSGPTRLLAANTGLIIELFDQLHEAGRHDLDDLETVLKGRLGLREEAEPVVPWTILVINLDLRPTAGDSGLLPGMLARLDFDAPDGVAAGAPRCSTCTVTEWCPVRANTQLLAGQGRDAVDRLAARAAVERGRSDPPRLLWDWAAGLALGNDDFAGVADPCESVARAATSGNRKWVWDRTLPATLFAGGEPDSIAARVGALDPSLQPSQATHDVLAAAGLEPETDAASVNALGGGAFAVAADFVRSAAEPQSARRSITARYLSDPGAWEVWGPTEKRFGDLLEEYSVWSRTDAFPGNAIDDLADVVQLALAQTFGVLHRDRAYLPLKTHDPRKPARVWAPIELDGPEPPFDVMKDVAISANRSGADLTGYQPLAVRVVLGTDDAGEGGVHVTIDQGLFRLLSRAAAGTVASTADLARFYALRTATDALARRAAETTHVLLAEAPSSSKRYLVQRRNNRVRATEQAS